MGNSYKVYVFESKWLLMNFPVIYFKESYSACFIQCRAEKQSPVN